jgi:hypothetical protein
MDRAHGELACMRRSMRRAANLLHIFEQPTWPTGTKAWPGQQRVRLYTFTIVVSLLGNALKHETARNKVSSVANIALHMTERTLCRPEVGPKRFRAPR